MQGFRKFRVDPLRQGSEWSLLLNSFDLGLDEDQLIELVEMTEDCLKSCPWPANAATSKAEAEDLSDVFADVSTYMTAPQYLDIASAFLDDILACGGEWTFLMSDLHPTNTRGVEGDDAVRDGTQ